MRPVLAQVILLWKGPPKICIKCHFIPLWAFRPKSPRFYWNCFLLRSDNGKKRFKWTVLSILNLAKLRPTIQIFGQASQSVGLKIGLVMWWVLPITERESWSKTHIHYYPKDGGPGVVWPSCSLPWSFAVLTFVFGKIWSSYSDVSFK